MPSRELALQTGFPVPSVAGRRDSISVPTKNAANPYSPWMEAASHYDVRNITHSEMRKMAKLLFDRGAIDGTTYALMQAAARRAATVGGKPPVETGRRYDFIEFFTKHIDTQTDRGTTLGIEYEIHILTVLDRIAAQRRSRLDVEV